MSSSIKRVFHSERGQSLIELTLITPLMLLLVFGVVEVGSVISTYLTLSHTTREGANLTSRGTDPNTALDAIILAAAPTIRDDNLGQWTTIYSRIIQDPATPCPPTPCTYIIDTAADGRIVRGTLGQSSQLGNQGDIVNTNLAGLDSVAPNQIFHAVEVYYDYGPNVITFIGNAIDKIFYERTIFTNISGII